MCELNLPLPLEITMIASITYRAWLAHDPKTPSIQYILTKLSVHQKLDGINIKHKSQILVTWTSVFASTSFKVGRLFTNSFPEVFIRSEKPLVFSTGILRKPSAYALINFASRGLPMASANPCEPPQNCIFLDPDTFWSSLIWENLLYRKKIYIYIHV